MNGKKVKQLRAMEKAAVTVLYEVTTKIYSNGQVSVTTNDNRAIDDPFLYNSIRADGDRAVLRRWQENRDKAEKIAAENQPRIVVPS